MDVPVLLVSYATGWIAPWMWGAAGILVGAAAAAAVIRHRDRQ
ncbi:hypothetical protein [Streptomonospora wellingtoniae]|uniref:Uncharacterized protein n=1 Tax=Streptomonospora wellingtoniae TaxID=3075544 RepID=A0ABU2KNY0_9ACTN|nr:hypothetical protein [Streptomonospora sp. DSM 45055]MDT0300981.1 hypothetical protein [Streptomonospora sp. DSM 45055]